MDPLDVGEVADDEHHNITYKPDGSDPRLHSETRKFKRVFSGGRENPPEFRKRSIDLDYIGELSDELMSRTVASRFEKAVTREVRQARPIQRVQYLLGHVYDVSWILLQ